jgi:hypothetical protein
MFSRTLARGQKGNFAWSGHAVQYQAKNLLAAEYRIEPR